ncbi:ComF family protein [Rhabdothermincola sediminis]|uniref:ComF family protein n=1 Tax=Rhabdothermincola sediminis TaxID=2751370 RepID=UPI001AA0229B|nr:phosphoribosyltransferase family protein [Rhabdothermincola sediminis]
MLSLLLPPTCGVCRSPGSSPCARCASELVPAAETPAPAGLESCRALIAYEGTGRLLVTALKYRNHREVLDHIAGPLAMLADPSAVDVVTWAPTTGSRRRDRGFDQARLLAEEVAQALRRPCRRLLDRLPGPPQTGKGVLERIGGPSFTARSVVGLRVLVVDDVMTTGSTLSRAAAALRREGATAIHGLALARTPRTGPAAVERAGRARQGRPGALKCGG